MTGTARRVE